jgi:CHAT domain-containing protein
MDPSILPALEVLHEKAKKLERETGGFSDTGKAGRRYVDGKMAEFHGQSDEALAAFLEAVELVERERGRLREERERSGFLASRVEYYNAAIGQLLQRRRHAEAFELMERVRARAMSDLLSSRTPGLADDRERSLYGEAVRLHGEIARRQTELTDLAVRGGRTAGEKARGLAAEVTGLEAQLAQLDARIAREAPRLRQLTVAQPATLAQLQQAMRDEHFEVLEYQVLENELIVWHIRADGVNVRKVFVPRSALEAKVTRLRRSLADRNETFDAATARQLYLMLVNPATDWMKTERLVIIPHDVLHQIPFQVLQDAQGRFLGERRALAVAPSSTILLSLRRDQPSAAPTLFAGADPDIPDAPDEVARVAQLYPGGSRVISDALPKEAEVKAAVRDREVVHLSVHGEFTPAEPLLSHLLLAPGGGDDGKLTAAEMFGLPLAKTRLVVLSACETGRAKADSGGEVQGMLRALLFAGAGSVVLSHWRVDSAATALWMETFHRHARSGSPVDAARAALARVRANGKFERPYYWAAFMVVGR